MPNKFASGKWAIAECDRCGQRYMLKQLKKLVIKTKQVNIKVCPECWEPDQPQLQLGMYPVDDPQAVRNPRPDLSYVASGQFEVEVGGVKKILNQGETFFAASNVWHGVICLEEGVLMDTFSPMRKDFIEG